MNDELFADEIRRRERARRKKGPVWTICSFILHIALFALIIFLTPAKSLIFEPKDNTKDAAKDLSADRIEEIAENLSDVRINELLEQIFALQAVLHNMDMMKEELAKSYDSFAEKTSKTAKAELKEFIDETERNQIASAKAQAVVRDEIAGIVADEKRDYRKDEVFESLRQRNERLMTQTSEKTNTAQGNAVNSLDKLQVRAEFVGFRKTAETAAKFLEAQTEAARMQDKVQNDVTEIAGGLFDVYYNEKYHSTGSAATIKNYLKRKADLKRRFEDRANEKQLQNQDLASKKQAELNARIGILRKALEEDEAKLEKLAQDEAREENRLVTQEVQAMKMAQAYELAKELEAAITESYKDIKATETAIARKMSFSAASKITDVAKPARMVANVEAIELKPRTKDDLDRQKQAQKDVVVETDNILDATMKMMDEAMEIVMPSRDDARSRQKKAKEVRWLEAKDFESKALEEKIAQMEREAVFQVEMDKAAAEDSSQKAKDLAALMNTLEATANESRKARDAGNAPPELKGGEKWLQPGNVIAVGDVPKDGKAIPAKWMYITSWHVIGPFPNPNRINLRRKFAPESVIDLDATYTGKDGKTLRWTFMQAHNRDQINNWGGNEKNAAMVLPDKAEEYAIYYAYAEVFFDKDCDRWVAIGSDDRSDVWVNDFHVWGSSNKLKGWTLNEDYRRIHFKKGRNKILLRCENGHWNLGWSMCIALDDATNRF